MIFCDPTRLAQIKLDMGTRNVTMVILDQDIKVAQYGQWDGYPSGQGLIILNFLKNNLDKLDFFKDKLHKLSFITKEELEAIDDWPKSYSHFSRDVAASILNVIMNQDITKLKDDSDFTADSLMCEWAYVIDLDNNTFEVYKGFNKTKLTEQDRFYMDGYCNSGYYPVKLLVKYDLDKLPKEDDFIKIGDAVNDKIQ